MSASNITGSTGLPPWRESSLPRTAHEAADMLATDLSSAVRGALFVWDADAIGAFSDTGGARYRQLFGLDGRNTELFTSLGLAPDQEADAWRRILHITGMTVRSWGEVCAADSIPARRRFLALQREFIVDELLRLFARATQQLRAEDYAGYCRTMRDAFSIAEEGLDHPYPIRRAMFHRWSAVSGDAIRAGNAAASFAMLLIGLEERHLAVELLGRLIDDRPESKSMLLQFGYTCSRIGRHDLELAAYQYWLENNDAPEVWNSMGVCLFELQLYEDALNAYAHSEELQSDNGLLHNNTGESAWRLGRTERALGSYERSITLAPTYPEVHRLFGDAMWQQGRFDVAYEAYGVSRSLGDRLSKDYITFMDNWLKLPDGGFRDPETLPLLDFDTQS